MGILHAAMSNSLEGNHVVAISDSDNFLTKLAKKAIPKFKFYPDYHLMLESEDIDALYLCTPSQTHYSITRDILRNYRGVSLFVEKPLALNGQEASVLASDARNLDAITMVGYQKRFAGVFQKTKELLDADILGEPAYLRAHSFGSNVLREERGWKFQKGSGGVTLEYGVHLLDLLIWFFGEPLSANSTFKSLFSSNVEDFVSSHVRFEKGLVGDIMISWSMRNYSIPEMLIEVHGKSGSLTVTEDTVSVVLERGSDRAGMDAGVTQFNGVNLDYSVPFLIASPENVLQEKAFLDSVKSKTQPLQNFESAARVNRFVDMILSS